MSHLVFAMLSLAAAGPWAKPERNYTIRGDGFIDPTGPGYRVPLHEARLTLRDDREFLVTLFARGERILVRGRWARRGNSEVERIDIDDAFGTRADGNGTLHYSDDGRREPIRLVLEGRTRQGRFRVDIRGEPWGRDDEWWRGGRRDGEERRGRGELGSGDRVFRNVDVTTSGEGMVRMSGVPDGRFSHVRLRLGTGRDASIDIDRPTRGTIRGVIREVRGTRVTIRVANLFGHEGSGDLVATMERDDEVARLEGSGTGSRGSWQLEFSRDGRVGSGWPGTDRNGGRAAGPLQAATGGSGNLSQDFGGSVAYDRIRVDLRAGGDALIVLEGRRQDLRLEGRWSDRWSGDAITIDVTRVNDLPASGRFELRLDRRDVESFGGDGRTDRGGFRVTFRRR